VALGHTGDDQAETVLMRLLEGAGPRGLAGIPPVRGIFIRPLIEASREAILDYCRFERLQWIEDPSNLDPKFLRNRLRHELLPFLASTHNPRIVEALRRVGRRSREAVESLEILAEREWERLASVDPDGVTFPLAELREMPPGLLGELLRLAKGRLHARAPLRESDHLALRRFMRSTRPSGTLRAADIVVERGPYRVRLSSAVARPSMPELALPVPGSLDLPFAGLWLEAVTFPKTSDYAPPAGSFSVAFDTADLPERLIVRGRRSGDRFQPFGSAGAKPLKKFLIDQRVPRWERSRVPLVLAGDEILWVVGIRRGEGRRVTPSTKLVLELRAIPR
jgi:tRNA(Ile)-lysidine synthase